MSTTTRLFATTVLIATMGIVSPAIAQQQEPLTLENEQAFPAAARDPAGVWTPTQLQETEPFELPIPEDAPATLEELEAQSEPLPDRIELGPAGDGAAPTVPVDPDAVDMLFQPTATTPQLLELRDVAPLDVGDFGAPFSTSPVAPPLFGYLEYPYRAAGKLFFRTPGGPSWCSASVLRPRIILTAGHCVHRGSGGSNGFYTNFLFVPAYQNGNAPLQAWNWQWVVVTGEWATSNGNVPNAADFAIIELEDRRFGSAVRRIGEVTGYFGYMTGVLALNHTKKLGYPGNLARGEAMQQVESGSWRQGGSNTILYGSNARGGSSGGGWLMNFASTGESPGQRPEQNRIVGVTSYGYIATGPKVQGSSVPGQSFLTILDMACQHRAGNC